MNLDEGFDEPDFYRYARAGHGVGLDLDGFGGTTDLRIHPPFREVGGPAVLDVELCRGEHN
jgi:hypothetical protein